MSDKANEVLDAVDVPDLLGDEQRAEMVGNAIRDLQSQQAALRIEQTINFCEDDDIVPSLSQGSRQTFSQRREQMQKAIDRLAEDYWLLKGQVLS